MQPQIGAVGAKLLYPDYTVRHAGIALDAGEVTGYAFRHFADADEGYFRRMLIASNVSVVSGDCLMVRRDVFDSVQGFNESLAFAFYDVDFCIRVREKGLRNVLLPFVRLIQREAAADAADPEEAERQTAIDRYYMQKHWGELLRQDPFFPVRFHYTRSI